MLWENYSGGNGVMCYLCDVECFPITVHLEVFLFALLYNSDVF